MLRRVCAANNRQSLSGVALATASRTLVFTPRVREYKFLAEEVLDLYPHYEQYAKATGSEDVVNKDLLEPLLEEAARMSSQVLFPTYTSTDSEGCTLKDGNVITPQAYKEVYKTYTEGGWTGVMGSAKYGGQGLPPSVGFMAREINVTGNWPFAMYPNLTEGAMQTLETWGSEELKDAYLPKLISGEWTGTMCLTEPHCGTDLSQVKTKAEKNADGTYKINGTKIFISAGDHDLTENVIHIVLARLPGSVPTTKGLSLFLVPRNLVKEDGSVEKEKNVKCIAIEEKMGIHSNATCQLSFEDSVGYLIGEENAGMKEMFTFMNGARMGCAQQGIAHAEMAFQNALNYARERGSMRALSGAKCPEKKQDPILVHSNVRHGILLAKAVSEGGRALVLDLARMLDLHASTKDKKLAKAIDDEIGFYTPIAKGCLTEWGLEAAIRCQQVWGGHGYIKGNGMEQIVRDARIGTIYEGTTGVQAMDFIGRKVLSKKGGEGKTIFGTRVSQLVRPHLFSRGAIGNHARQLWIMHKRWKIATTKIGLKGMKDREFVGAAAEDFLMYSGYMMLGYYWLRMAVVAQKQVAAGKDTDGFYQAKLDTCEFVFDRLMPRAEGHYIIMLNPSMYMTSKDEKWDV